MSARGDLEKTVRAARKRGWQTVRSCGKHEVIRYVNGGQMTIPSSPSDVRAITNMKKQMERIERGVMRIHA